MKAKIATLILAVVAMIGLASVPSAKANLLDKKTILTVTGSAIEIPGVKGRAIVLAPGRYVVKEVDPFLPDIVGIWNADQTHIITMTHTIPVQRVDPADGVVITVGERAGTVEALNAWFYPGNTIGQQFVYGKHQRPASRVMVPAS